MLYVVPLISILIRRFHNKQGAVPIGTAPCLLY
ncbi:Protein of unknown function [Bacillus mycoides]|nr:Protein of unknown function [Bacillus mycoides]